MQCNVVYACMRVYIYKSTFPVAGLWECRTERQLSIFNSGEIVGVRMGISTKMGPKKDRGIFPNDRDIDSYREHDIPRYSMIFHDIPRYSTIFHDIPRYSTIFHDIPLGILGYHIFRQTHIDAERWPWNVWSFPWSFPRQLELVPQSPWGCTTRKCLYDYYIYIYIYIYIHTSISP